MVGLSVACVQRAGLAAVAEFGILPLGTKVKYLFKS